MSFAGINLGPRLGKGSYGEVYKIQYKGRDCALKILKSEEEVGLPELSELNALSNIKHPNLIELIDFIIEGNEIGFILPLAKYDLYNAVRIQSNSVFIDRWIYEIISAVFFLHKNGLYHCDLKPENILIMDDDRVCVADFGLVNRAQISSNDICQTIASPQLLDRRRKQIPWRAFTATVNQPSNEFQDDIWALGFTIYLMLKSYYPQRIDLNYNNDVSYYRYMVALQKNNFFVDNGMPPKYASLLIILLNPDAPSRSINLNMLLGTPALTGYDRYIDGEIVKVINKNPVTEKELPKLPDFLKNSIDIMKSFGVEDYVYIQLIDLCYRCISFCLSNPRGANLMITVIIILANVNNIESPILTALINSVYAPGELILYETELLNYLEGHVTREIFADYIDKSKYNRCIEWIIANPERYEQLSTPQLVQMFNTMFP